PIVKITKSTTRNSADLTRDGERTTASLILDSYLSSSTEILVDMGILNVNGNSLETTTLTINPMGTLLMPEGSEVVMFDNGTINCHGEIISTGTEINPNAFYAIGTDNFDFRIKNGGLLGAQWTSFSQFDTYYGLYFETGSEVDTETGLMNCSFYNGVSNGSLIAFNNTQDVQIVNAIFPDNTNGEIYNVRKMNDAGSVTLTESTGNFSGETHEYDPYNRIEWGTLEAPQNVTVEVIGNNIRLQWNSVTGATSYKVFSALTPDVEFTEDLSGVLNGTEWTTTLSDNRRFYRIVAVKNVAP
ncbi:MAG: hypothetical protein PHR06_10175, partial [Candidatus Cloacimonetes bacterium]|nr:hypothetical protein [Candidatus Cloacimonadota bacterium]